MSESFVVSRVGPTTPKPTRESFDVGQLSGADFFGSLALSVVSSIVLAELAGRIGNRFRLPEGLVGIVTALGADSPEIAVAVTAITAGGSDLGVGIVLGSNLFNIAALLGASAVAAGAIRIRRRALVLQGTVALMITVVGVALVLGALGPVVSLVLVALVVMPYLVLSSLREAWLRTIVPGGSIQRFLIAAVADQEKELRSGQTAPVAARTDLLAVVPVLVAVVVASIGLVHSARSLGQRYANPGRRDRNTRARRADRHTNLLAAIRLA